MSVGWMPVRLMGLASAERRMQVEAAERAGVDHIGVGDHISFFVGLGNDGLTTAAAILAVADRPHGEHRRVPTPSAPPDDHRSPAVGRGRSRTRTLPFGVGVGGEDPHELEVCGVDPRTRGRRMDESMQVVRELLTGEPLDFDGEFFSLSQALVLPAPTGARPDHRRWPVRRRRPAGGATG